MLKGYVLAIINYIKVKIVVALMNLVINLFNRII